MPCRCGQVIITTHHFIVGAVGVVKRFFLSSFFLLKVLFTESPPFLRAIIFISQKHSLLFSMYELSFVLHVCII